MGRLDHQSASSFMATRQIDDATITVVSDGELLWAPAFPVLKDEAQRVMPEADAEGRIWLGLNVVLIEIGTSRIVVDPALDDPGTSFEARFIGQSTMELRRSPGLAAALRQLDWTPEAVTHVIITHPHGDHYGGVMTEHNGNLSPRFPNARHFLGRADWEGNDRRQDPNAELNRRLGAVDRRSLLELVDGEEEVAAGVQLVPAPGETPGHMVVRLLAGGETLYILGDLFHHRCEVEHLDWAPPHADARQLEQTRRLLFAALAQPGVLAIAPHEAFPGWGRMTRTGNRFRWEPFEPR
jgi:glyoxylase-like metal-dependent hydrolase (beta-lactamase superfamily II)